MFFLACRRLCFGRLTAVTAVGVVDDGSKGGPMLECGFFLFPERLFITFGCGAVNGPRVLSGAFSAV